MTEATDPRPTIHAPSENPSNRESDSQRADGDLVDKPTLHALMARSDRPGLIQAGLHFGLIMVTGAVVWNLRDSWLVLPAMLLHGVGLVYLFAAQHECAHRTAFKSRWLNETVIWIAGLATLLPPAFYRAFHFAHHRHTQDPERDPELRFKKVEQWGGYLKYMTGATYWQRGVQGLIRGALGKAEAPFIGPRDREAIIRDCRIMVAIYAGAALSMIWLGPWPLLLWLIPILIAQPIARFWIITEHTGLPAADSNDPGTMLAVTRTIKSNAVMRFLNWNMGYHAEHHAYPAVPFHALPKLNGLLADRIAHTEPGYVAFHRRWIGRLGGQSRDTALANDSVY